MTRTVWPLAILLLTAIPAAAQDDRAAGLFTEARQLPLVSQSAVVWIHGGEARVELDQVFANDGATLGQADYRLHLPRAATITGFGFWHDGSFLAAALKERASARHDHTVAAAAGRATALLERDGTIHSFSVFPVPAGGLLEVEVSVALPVSTERGRSSVRLPLDAFLGHSHLTSAVVVHVETQDKLDNLGVEGASFDERRRDRHSAEIVLAADDAIEIWWTAEMPPLLVAAESAPLDDGTAAIQLRLALNDRALQDEAADEIVLLLDASYSMRRRAEAVAALIGRVLDQALVPVEVVAVAERELELDALDPRLILQRFASGEAGHVARWDDLVDAAVSRGCDAPRIRCVAVTDPQLPGLPPERALETVLLSDADELVHFAALVGPTASMYQPGIEPKAALYALADELVLPVLELRAVQQDGVQLEPVGSPRRRVAAGGLLRLAFESRTSGPLEIALAVAGKPVVRTVRIEPLDAASRLGRAVRRSFYRGRLDDWTAAYRRNRDPELRRQIIDVSLREEIPTELTSLQVASPDRALPATATPAPLLRAFGVALLALGVVVLLAGRRRLP